MWETYDIKHIELHYNSLIQLRLVQLSLSRVILVCPDRTLNFIWPDLSDL